MDWITQLPETELGNDAILVVMDSYSKRAHFIPTKTTASAAQTAYLFFDHIYRLHGMPKKIVSDRDSKITSNFWKTLYGLLGTNLAMSTPYHPQTDGATERLNRTLGGMLRTLTQNASEDWDTYLTASEFAYNNSKHSSTEDTPFMLDNGQHPNDPLSLSSPLLTSQLSERTPSNEEAHVYLQEWLDRLKLARVALEESQQRYKHYYDLKRDAHRFKKGDLVYLDTKELSFVDKVTSRTRKRHKLDERFSGPYEIEKLIGKGSACKLKLGMNEKFHPVQSISRLWPQQQSRYFREAHNLAAPRPVISEQDGILEELLEVEAIQGHRFSGRQQKFYIKWKGYPRSENTWEPRRNLVNAQGLLKKYEATNGLL
jgi:hypothetical protein